MDTTETNEEISAYESAVALEESLTESEHEEEVVEAAPAEEEEEEVVDAEPEPEPAAEVVAEAPKQTVDAKFDELLGKEREIREREEAIKENTAGLLDPTEMAELAQSDPLAFLERFNITYDQITDRIIDAETVDPKTKALEDRLSKFEQAEEKRKIVSQQAEMQKQVNEYMTQLTNHIEGSNYDMIQALGAQELVQQTIVAHWKETKQELSMDDACERVESYLVETELPKIKKLLDSGKGRELFGTKETVQQTKETTMPTKTITNKTTSAAPRRSESGESTMDRAYRLEAELKRG